MHGLIFVIFKILLFAFYNFVSFLSCQNRRLVNRYRERKRPLGASTESRMQIRGGCSGGSSATTILSKNLKKKKRERDKNKHNRGSKTQSIYFLCTCVYVCARACVYMYVTCLPPRAPCSSIDTRKIRRPKRSPSLLSFCMNDRASGVCVSQKEK